MKHIELKRLELRYFKGAINSNFEFNHISSVFGDNGTGKSTIFDAFSWVLFGKDSNGDSDIKFSIKTLDAKNNVIQKVDHSVYAVLDVEGQEITLKRVLREKWVKKKGALETVFEGNVTDYFYNEVPKSKREYEDKINELLDEVIFKMITDPLAFNSLHWEKQRQLLISIVGDVSNNEIASGNKEYEALLNKLVGKDLEEFKKELKAKRLLLNKSIESIPTRIDEAIRSKPESLDFETAEKEKVVLISDLNEVDSLIEDRNKAMDEASKKRSENSNKVFELKTKNQNIEFEIKRGINSSVEPLENPIVVLESKLESANATLEKYNKGIQDYKYQQEKDTNELSEVTAKLSKLREEFSVENAKELKFDEGSFNCPGCKRPLEANDIESEKARMLEDFKADKKTALNRINTNGVTLNSRKEALEKTIAATSKSIEDGNKIISELTNGIEQLQASLNSERVKPVAPIEDPKDKLDAALKSNEEYQSNLNQISELEKLLSTDTGFDISDLKTKKESIKLKLDEVNSILSKKDLIATVDARVKELSAEEKSLAQQIADIEKQEFVAQEFTNKSVSALESKINALFTNVQFKMFKEQTDGVIPWCTALVNGVPFQDANTASKINAGLSIINVLCRHYNVTGPIFIDNRESVIKLIDTESQIINLIVSEPDKVLRII